MTIDEQIKVLQAYKEGKEIEQSTFIITKSGARINNTWEPISFVVSNNIALKTESPFNFAHYDYRIKPKQEYQPYKEISDVYHAIQVHGPYVQHNSGKLVSAIQMIELNNDILYINGHSSRSFLENFTWVNDGSQCGQLV